MSGKLIATLPLFWLLAGRTALHSAGGRIALPVMVPAGLLLAVLWLLRRRGTGRGRGRGPGPDFDDRD